PTAGPGANTEPNQVANDGTVVSSPGVGATQTAPTANASDLGSMGTASDTSTPTQANSDMGSTTTPATVINAPNLDTASAALIATQTSPDNGAAAVSATVTPTTGNIAKFELSSDQPVLGVTINGAPATSPVGVPIRLSSTVTDSATVTGFRYV